MFVPINPMLKPRQVGYILRDCNVRMLVTSLQRADDLAEELAAVPRARTRRPCRRRAERCQRDKAIVLAGCRHCAGAGRPSRVIDTDMTAILYTSGSTGNPKGVVLSHRNMVAGAKSVSQYLENNPDGSHPLGPAAELRCRA